MENIFSKIATFGIFMLVASCAFDGESTKVLAKLDEKYYVLKVAGYTTDDRMQIGYSIDGKGSYGILSSDCNDIYYNKDTIMYNKILFEGSDTSYYVIPINPKREDGLANDPIQINEDVFKNNIVRFNKV